MTEFSCNESNQQKSICIQLKFVSTEKQMNNDCTVGEGKNTDNKKERADQQQTHTKVIIRITIIPAIIKTWRTDNISEPCGKSMENKTDQCLVSLRYYCKIY